MSAFHLCLTHVLILKTWTNTSFCGSCGRLRKLLFMKIIIFMILLLCKSNEVKHRPTLLK